MSAGTVVWITGLPSAGKSLLGERLHAELRARAMPTCLLDGDAVRAALVPALGYSELERDQFYETLARLAALLAEQGLTVVVPATAHRRAFRERARRFAPAFVEVWVDTPIAECERRDDKKLYAESRHDELQHLPGAGEPYESPERPDVVAHGGADPEALQQLLRLLARSSG